MGSFCSSSTKIHAMQQDVDDALRAMHTQTVINESMLRQINKNEIAVKTILSRCCELAKDVSEMSHECIRGDSPMTLWINTS